MKWSTFIDSAFSAAKEGLSVLGTYKPLISAVSIAASVSVVALKPSAESLPSSVLDDVNSRHTKVQQIIGHLNTPDVAAPMIYEAPVPQVPFYGDASYAPDPELEHQDHSGNDNANTTVAEENQGGAPAYFENRNLSNERMTKDFQNRQETGRAPAGNPSSAQSSTNSSSNSGSGTFFGGAVAAVKAVVAAVTGSGPSSNASSAPAAPTVTPSFTPTPTPTSTPTATPSLAWSPLTNFFGNILVGANSSATTFIFTASGSGTASGCSAPTITDTTNFSILTDNCGASSLDAGSTCTVEVQAHPTSVGAKTATLSRDCSIGGTVATTANLLTATGTSAILAWSPLTRDFGNVNVGANSASFTFTLTNSGTASSTGCSAPSLSNSADFTIVTDNCGVSNLTSGSSTCDVIIQASPKSSGTKTATLSRNCVVGGTIATTLDTISTYGMEPDLRWDLDDLNFEKLIIGQVSSEQKFTLINDGNADATGCTDPILSDSTNFSIIQSDCLTSEVAAKGGTCSVTIQANPTSVGVFTTNLSRTCSRGGTVKTSDNKITAEAEDNDVTFTPLFPNLGTIKFGDISPIQTLTVSNHGKDNAICGGTQIGGGKNFFIVRNGCDKVTLKENDTCEIDVRGAPTGSDAIFLDKLTVDCEVNGKGVTGYNQLRVDSAAADPFSWDFLYHDFGKVDLIKGSDSFTFTLTNNGTLDGTNCSPPTLSDLTNFSIVKDNCGNRDSSNKGGSCDVEVKATPTTEGVFTSTLERECSSHGIISTTKDEITVKGIQSVGWDLANYDFGSVKTSADSDAVIFTLNNTTGLDLIGCSITKFTDPTFAVSKDSCSGQDTKDGAYCAVEIYATKPKLGRVGETLQMVCTSGGTFSTKISVTGVP